MMELCLLAVDDESLALSDLTAALQAAEPAATVHAYTDPTKALEAVRTGEILPDIAFLDIQMRGWTGLDLALELKKTIPTLEIIFVTAYSQYALESYSLHARGYLMKPVTAEAIEEELRNIGLTTVPVRKELSAILKCFMRENRSNLPAQRARSCLRIWYFAAVRPAASGNVRPFSMRIGNTAAR